MYHSISLSAQQMLALVRSTLWQNPVDEALFSKNEVDWQQIAQLALQQTVGILTFEGAFSLKQSLSPPKEWIQKAFSFIERNRRTHMLIDKCVAESVTRLSDKGITALLLKGQAYARSYPRSEMRQCGDIDLFVGEDSYHSAYTAIKDFGWKREDQFLPKAKHYGCWLQGIRIELHRMAGQLPSRSADRKFQQWSRNQVSTSKRRISIAGKGIPVPTPTFDIVFVFLHLYHHFRNGGIGLRHVCDWTMLMHAHSKEINPNELEKLLLEFRLMRAWKIFAPIAVEHLGLPETACPFYSKSYRKHSKMVLSMIMKEGNFGRARHSGAKRQKGYFAWKIYSFRHQTLCQMKKLWIDPNTISRAYGSYVIKGMTRVIKDIMKMD
ncbi:MAG: nucleotidyltransferase family protein [Muribaculaceae bacterium]|nr:nucleotidyltransferase family protein [Muribaculaceae bacterium]